VVCLEVVEVNPLLDTKGNKMAETAFEVLELPKQLIYGLDKIKCKIVVKAHSNNRFWGFILNSKFLSTIKLGKCVDNTCILAVLLLFCQEKSLK
jgi:hypothetical protein